MVLFCSYPRNKVIHISRKEQLLSLGCYNVLSHVPLEKIRNKGFNDTFCLLKVFLFSSSEDATLDAPFPVDNKQVRAN